MFLEPVLANVLGTKNLLCCHSLGLLYGWEKRERMVFLNFSLPPPNVFGDISHTHTYTFPLPSFLPLPSPEFFLERTNTAQGYVGSDRGSVLDGKGPFLDGAFARMPSLFQMLYVVYLWAYLFLGKATSGFERHASHTNTHQTWHIYPALLARARSAFTDTILIPKTTP